MTTLHHRSEGAGEPTCVLLHGLAVDSEDLRPLAAHLRPRHRVVSVDLRGHGQSPGGDGYEIADFAADARALAERLGVRDAVWIGHSLGGLVALEVAATAPEHVGALVILDSSPAPTAAAAAGLRALADGLAGVDGEQVWAEFLRTAMPGAPGQMATAPIALVSEVVRGFIDYAEQRSVDALRTCAMPILIVGASAPTPDPVTVSEAAPQA
ncbi:MAG TPA: alpha/beta hydrolase family protein, partial [Solirubrobacteraceae bacterium]